MPNWKTWKAQADIECLAKARYESIGISLQIQLKALIAILEPRIASLTNEEARQLTVAKIILEHQDPFHPYPDCLECAKLRKLCELHWNNLQALVEKVVGKQRENISDGNR